jgi:hypothetical protein
MPVDASGRTISHLRISVTDRCQLRCRYCLPEEGVPLLDRRDILSYEEILAFVRLAAEEGITSARVTGGEPLLRRGIVSLVRELAGLGGLEDLALTTNGILLPELAGPLREAGLARINIGLSSLDPETYRELTRGGDLAIALDGVRAAVAATSWRRRSNRQRIESAYCSSPVEGRLMSTFSAAPRAAASPSSAATRTSLAAFTLLRPARASAAVTSRAHALTQSNGASDAARAADSIDARRASFC